jgi:hypothetical protein
MLGLLHPGISLRSEMRTVLVHDHRLNQHLCLKQLGMDFVVFEGHLALE